VRHVREFVRGVKGFARVTLVERDCNWGLARNIIDGVTTQVKAYGRVIVLEDDLVVAPHFLRFMNEALDCYEDEPQVGHIQACDFTQDASLPDTFLIQWTGSLGMGHLGAGLAVFQSRRTGAAGRAGAPPPDVSF